MYGAEPLLFFLNYACTVTAKFGASNVFMVTKRWPAEKLVTAAMKAAQKNTRLNAV